MIKGLIRSLKRFVSRVKQHFKQWSKPVFLVWQWDHSQTSGAAVRI